MSPLPSRRSFLQGVSLGSLGFLAAEGLGNTALAQAPSAGKEILGAEGVKTSARPQSQWKPVSERKIRVGIVGNGVCKFGPSFGFQDHPNVTVAAVSDLFPDRCQEMSQKCRCKKTYPSLEELVKDDTLEAVFVATDAASHARHCIEVLKHGKHVACAVPAVWASVDDAHQLYEAVQASGKKYMMFETSAFHEDCYAMRQIYQAGGFGKLLYTEGEYHHFSEKPIPSYKNWRLGAPPQWYPTHANAYYVCVTNGSFTEVSCLGMPSLQERYQPQNNPYKNSFGTEIALLRTSEGGMARMAGSRDIPRAHGDVGRVYGQRGWMNGMSYQGQEQKLPSLERPPLPPSVATGHHGGSSGFLTNEFVTAILEDRNPMIDIAMALNMTVAGIVAHESALKNGELRKIPQFA